MLRGNGDGTFAAPVTFPNTSGFDSPAVAAVDLNNDGKLDVVIAHEIACYTAPCVTSDLISVMIGNGDGTFQPSREIPVGRGMSEIAVGDYNRDGFKDLAIGGTQGQVYLLHGVGDGTFVQQPTVTAVVDHVLHPRHGHRRRRLQRRLDPGPRGGGTPQREPDGDPDRQRRRHVPRTAGPHRSPSSTFLSSRPSPITTVTASRTSRSAWETAASV